MPLVSMTVSQMHQNLPSVSVWTGASYEASERGGTRQLFISDPPSLRTARRVRHVCASVAVGEWHAMPGCLAPSCILVPTSGVSKEYRMALLYPEVAFLSLVACIYSGNKSYFPYFGEVLYAPTVQVVGLKESRRNRTFTVDIISFQGTMRSCKCPDVEDSRCRKTKRCGKKRWWMQMDHPAVPSTLLQCQHMFQYDSDQAGTRWFSVGHSSAKCAKRGSLQRSSSLRRIGAAMPGSLRGFSTTAKRQAAKM